MTLPGDQTYRPADEKPERPKLNGSPREQFGEDFEAAHAFADSVMDAYRRRERARDVMLAPLHEKWARLRGATYKIEERIEAVNAQTEAVCASFEGGQQTRLRYLHRFRQDFAADLPSKAKGVALTRGTLCVKINTSSPEFASDAQIVEGLTRMNLPAAIFNALTRTTTKTVPDRNALKDVVHYGPMGEALIAIPDEHGELHDKPVVYAADGSTRSIMREVPPSEPFALTVKGPKGEAKNGD